MKKPLIVSMLAAIIVSCISVSVIAGDFYVVPTNRVFISWDKKLTADKRFQDALDGNAVLDKETGLVWKKTITALELDWTTAMDYCHQQNVDERKGWRLPSVEELASLLDGAALPTGHPFTLGEADYFWTSTESAANASNAFYVRMSIGNILTSAKSNTYYVWLVRGGK